MFKHTNHEHKWFVYNIKTEFVAVPETDKYTMVEYAIVVCSCPDGPTIKKVKVDKEPKGV